MQEILCVLILFALTCLKSVLESISRLSILHLYGPHHDRYISLYKESEFNELEPRLKSAKNRFQWSAGLNLETLNTILSETNHI